MAYLQPHVVPGERRRGMVLVCDGYRYQKNRTIAGTKIYWRCSVPACRVPIQTNDFDLDGDIVVLDNHYPEHTHQPENERLDRFDFLREIKSAIRRDPSIPIRRAYDQVFATLPNHQRINVPMFEEIRSSLQRCRASLLPLSRVPLQE